MNPDNYTSLEMSRKLVEAGIVMETEHTWQRIGKEWMISDICDPSNDIYVPAPSMSELWRELPEYTTLRSLPDGVSEGWNNPVGSRTYQNANPCDALAGLLIWLNTGRE